MSETHTPAAAMSAANRAGPRRRAAADDPRHRARLPRADRCAAPGQRPHARARNDAVRRRFARARWTHARDLIYPAFRPVGTGPRRRGSFDRDTLAGHANQSHAQPFLDQVRPGCRSSTPSMPGRSTSSSTATTCCRGGSEPAEIQDAAIAEPGAAGRRPRRGPTRCRASAAWSARTPATAGTPPASCCPRSSTHLVAELGPPADPRGLPERHLLTAGSLRPGDEDFAALFADFVVEQSGGADEPVDRRVFELVDGRLVEFAGRPPPDGGDRATPITSIRLEVADAVATITLDRPDALNALTVPMKGSSSRLRSSAATRRCVPSS